MYTHDLFYLQQEWKRGLHLSINRFIRLNHNYQNVQNINVTKTYIRIKCTLPRRLKRHITITIQRSVRDARHTQRLVLKQTVRTFAWGALS